MAAGQGVANDVGADEAVAAEDEDAEAGAVRASSPPGGLGFPPGEAVAPPG